MADDAVKVQRLDEAVQTLHKRPGLCNDASIPTYSRLARAVLSRSKESEALTDHATVVSQLREVLYKLANQYRSQTANKQLSAEIEMLLMAAHYSHMMLTCKAQGLKEMAAKCSITLLKYPEVVQADKAFYLAGMMCKEANNKNLAFMLLNR